MKPSVKVLVVFLLLATALVLSRRIERNHAPKSQSPLRCEVYVWQMRDTAELHVALDRSSSTMDSLHFLASEISIQKSEYRTNRSKLAKNLLENRGLVLRVGSSVSAKRFQDADFRALLDGELKWIADFEPREVHLDFDCPQSALSDYAELLKSIRDEFSGIKFVITALPAWLVEDELRNLLAACDGVVLQLHSLNLPEQPDQPVVICDPVAARKAVERMERLKTRYRVALSTYGCEVFFDEHGKVLDVVSEDSVSKDGSTASRRTVGSSDPVGLALLVHEWKRQRPDFMQGVVWYRLPLDTDRRNWRWVTLERVARGEVPDSRLELAAEPTPTGTWDVVLRNLGCKDELLPEIIDPGGEFLALEGLNGYAVHAEENLVLEQVSWPWLAPSDRLVVGWLRPANHKTKPRPSLRYK